MIKKLWLDHRSICKLKARMLRSIFFFFSFLLELNFFSFNTGLFHIDFLRSAYTCLIRLINVPFKAPFVPSELVEFILRRPYSAKINEQHSTNEDKQLSLSEVECRKRYVEIGFADRNSRIDPLSVTYLNFNVSE